jgi:hypothetical protein
LNSNPRQFCFVFFYLYFVGESCLLVSWCAGGRCGMVCSDEGHDRSRRPGAEDRGWSQRSGTRWSGGREVGWCRVRSAPDTWRLGVWVSWLSLKTKVSKPLGQFLAVWPQNLLRRFSPVWPQNWWRWFFLVWPQNRWSVSWLSLKTKVVEGFPVWASKLAALVW